MAGTPLKNLRMFEELCGKNAFHSVILTTTMWDEVDKEIGEERERELKEKYWKLMLARNSTTSRFLRTRESAFDLIEPLIEAANKRSSVLLQDELVEMRKSLPATAAGQELFSAMGQLVSQREDLLRRIRHEMKHSDGDKMVLQPLQEEHQELQKNLEATVIEMRRLRLPLGQRFMIMTDKFFSSKFESLRSMITKRLSKPAALNIESLTSSMDSSFYIQVSPADHDFVPTGAISRPKDPNDYTPQSPGSVSHTTPDNTLSSHRTMYPTPHGSSPVVRGYLNSDHSHTPDNTVPSDRTVYTPRHGSFPAGLAYLNSDHLHTPDNTVTSDRTMNTPRHGSSPTGPAYLNSDYSHTPDNAVPSDRTMYTPRHGSSPAGPAYLNSDHSHTPNNTVSPSDRTMYTPRHGSSPAGPVYLNYDHSYTPDNTASPSTRRGSLLAGQTNLNYDRELPPKPSVRHDEHSQSYPFHRTQNPNDGYQG